MCQENVASVITQSWGCFILHTVNSFCTVTAMTALSYSLERSLLTVLPSNNKHQTLLS